MAYSGPAEAPAPTVPFTLNLPPGGVYRSNRLFFIGVLGFTGFVVTLALLDTTVDLLTKAEALGGFSPIPLLAAIIFVFSRMDRSLSVDEAGVRLSRKGRVKLEIPWDEVSKVETGWTTYFIPKRASFATVATWGLKDIHVDPEHPGRPLFRFVRVCGKKGRSIQVVQGVQYNTPPESIEVATQVLLRLANARSILVEWKGVRRARES